MCALSHHIREQPNWWEKVKDETIIQKWRKEAPGQVEEDDDVKAFPRKLTPAMVKSHLCTTPPILTLISRSIMCSGNSTDTRHCVIQRLG